MENAKGIREKLESDLEKLGIKVHSKRNDLACIKMCIAEGMICLVSVCICICMTVLYMYDSAYYICAKIDV